MNFYISVTLCIIILLLIFYFVLWWIKNTIFFSNIKTNCKYRRFGCCPDDMTPKLDIFGSNCRGF
jgi:hypothetical protein